LTFATVLYSQGFYDELFRVLKHKGKIYHYTGHPGSKNRGVHLQDNVLKRMQRSGFKNLKKVFNGVSGEKI